MQDNGIGFGQHFRMLFELSGREDRLSFWTYSTSATSGSQVTTPALLAFPLMIASKGESR